MITYAIVECKVPKSAAKKELMELAIGIYENVPYANKKRPGTYWKKQGEVRATGLFHYTKKALRTKELETRILELRVHDLYLEIGKEEQAISVAEQLRMEHTSRLPEIEAQLATLEAEQAKAQSELRAKNTALAEREEELKKQFRRASLAARAACQAQMDEVFSELRASLRRAYLL
jgi:DNA repair exonuclease SbcCD ATPase subunit